MTNNTAIWADEYLKKGIPSSFRETPSHSVVWFEDYLRAHSLKPGTVLDIGAGKGRNALFLKKQGHTVSCIDLLAENVTDMKDQGLSACCHDLAKPFPYNETFDYAIDIFCFKHIVEPKAIQNYLSELKRLLKRGGTYLLSLASVEDGFYGPLLKDPSRLIIDPVSQIPSILYRRKDIEQLFSGFNLIEFSEKRSLGPMHGKTYVRVVLSFIFELPLTL